MFELSRVFTRPWWLKGDIDRFLFQMRLVIRQLVGLVGYLCNQQLIMRLWGYQVNIEIIYESEQGTN